MKILSVLIENLNSLQGKWYIDFTTQAFVDNGLFAITGPTGAGKSTILDAICIALYHETPRLSSLSKTNAEVMNKDKGYCSAEVRFEVQGHIYLAKWSIRRSRNRADGNLQAPTGTLTCETTQTDITTKLSDKVPAVVALTKLNFKRFTKSMMLSQGEFSAFLNAGDNDRSELLEQLTGTEIYSDISKRVFDEHKILKQRMALLTTEQSAKDLLSDTDKALLIDNIALIQSQFTVEKSRLDAVVEHQHWWQQHTQYTLALEEAQRDHTQAQTTQREQQSQLAKLDLARPAHKLAPLFTRQKELQQRCDVLQLSITKQQAEQPQLVDEDKTAKTSLDQANHDYTQQLAVQTHLIQLVNEQVIPLDTSIAGQHLQVEKFTATLNKTQQLMTDTHSALRTDKQVLQNLTKERDDISAYLEQHQSDSLVAEHIGVWKLEYQTLLTLVASYNQAKTDIHNAQIDNEPVGNLAQVHRVIAAAKDKLINALAISSVQPHLSPINALLEESVDSILQANTLTTCAHFYQIQIKSEQALLRLHGQWVDANSAYQTLVSEHHTLESTLLQQNALLPSYSQQAQADSTILELAQNNMSMQQQLATYSQQLSDLDTCPLCASSEFGDYHALHLHTNEQAQNGEFSEQIAQYQSAQQASTEAYNQLTQDINTQEILLQKNKTAQDACCDKIQTLEMQCLADATNLGMLFPSNPELATEQLNQLPSQLNAFDTIRAALTQLQQCHAIAVKYAALADLETTITQQHDTILAAVHLVGFTQQSTIDTDGVFAQWLTQKSVDLTQWQSKQSEHNKLSLAINDMTSSISLNQQIITQTMETDTQTRTELAVLQGELTDNIHQRERIFGSQDPKQALHDMNELVNQCNHVKTTCLHNHQTVSAKLAALNNSLQKDRQSLATERANLSTAKAKFDQGLQLSVFASEDDFIHACIDEAELDQLITLENTLNTTLTKTTSVLNQAQKNLEQHLRATHAHYYQTVPSAEVDTQLAQQQLQFSDLNERLGQLKGQLAENDKREQAISNIKMQIDALQKSLHTYGYLDELIGSSDGKKFRKFAQGLTLDNLIYLANLQLVDFDGRYELKRKDNQSLDMVVVDRWQGDTERDTRTLSGGESFLVSLALALGLSDLVSQDISIDSLFLDEGFGTLDSDTLDTALDVLDTLNAKGKMIGVISHVEAMKQRIPLQIKITKQSGLGISTLDEQYRYTQ